MKRFVRRGLTRRDFLKATAGTTAIAFAGFASSDAQHFTEEAEAGGKVGKASTSDVPVGVQLYCFRHLLEEDFEGTLAEVAKLGYDGVEFAGYYNYADDPAGLRSLVEGHGLGIAGAHIGLGAITGEELQRSIDFHGELGNPRLIVAGIGEETRGEDTIMQTAEIFTTAQEALRPHGMSTGYHCHAYSFQEMVMGKTVWDAIADNTPEDFILQLDTGNASNGEADNLAVIRNDPGRIKSMHVKPHTPGAEHPFAPFIGDDSLPWQEIFDLSESEGGVEWYVVEYEEESHPPLEALKTNRERVRSFGR
ncbi:MAG: TIM barrel protein [Bacteroidetes bacterium]|nr:TIM barrel protein [Bacteroidota bacterium]